jgi:TPP-dependent pyruvate/acetoin dehydrogenase alpha subunit
VFFGDGAVQTGAFHETLNMAALWAAPLLLVCENNGWVEFSSREEHTRVAEVAAYGSLHGIATARVDGTDVEAVAEAASALLEPMRAGAGPALLECAVSRMGPHYEGDWRAREEERDPLALAAQALGELGVDRPRIAALRDADELQARALLADVLAHEPMPDPREDTELVFAEPL